MVNHGQKISIFADTLISVAIPLNLCENLSGQIVEIHLDSKLSFNFQIKTILTNVNTKLSLRIT